MSKTNIKMLQVVANGLGDLKYDMAFVGGAVAPLYASDPAVSDIRVTLDVDCVIEISSKRDYAILEELLRTKGFENDTTIGAPICRWVFKNIKVDVMPTNEEILGFSNQWYTIGIENKILKTLPDGTEIYLFPPHLYIAAKLEAYKNRGGTDLRQSHDFEDIIYIIDNYPDLLNDIHNSDKTVKEYLSGEFQILLGNKNLSEGIETALPYGSGDERVRIILDLMIDIAGVV